MFEKVNPSHPDKVADRIAGAIVDMAYKQSLNPKIAVEVLIGHGECNIIAETSEEINPEEVERAVKRIAGQEMNVRYKEVKQDKHLAENQKEGLRCGDNGIFKGMPVTYEQYRLQAIAKNIYEQFPTDGKYIIDTRTQKLIICQSQATTEELRERKSLRYAIINPLGEWVGGTDTDTGATNRKLGSDMGDAVTGGGLHGKDLSKADVSVNIWCHLKAQRLGQPWEAKCAIGDAYVDGVPYVEIVREAREYISKIGGFEKFAEWGLIR